MVSYIEPAWPDKVIDERSQQMVTAEHLRVTIYVWYEGMRIHLPFLPYEAAYEEVVRRCELALGGRRLPPTVWFTCRACCRRLSLSNDPQRRMPGSCMPLKDWEWNLNIPYKVFITLEQDPDKNCIPMRMPSKYEKIDDVCLVALRALKQDSLPCRIVFNGEAMPYESTVEECNIKENDHIILELQLRLQVVVRDANDISHGYEVKAMSHEYLDHVMESVIGSINDVKTVEMNNQVIWKAGDSLEKTIWDFGMRNDSELTVAVSVSVDVTNSSVQTDEKVSFSCQTENWDSDCDAW